MLHIPQKLQTPSAIELKFAPLNCEFWHLRQIIKFYIKMAGYYKTHQLSEMAQNLKSEAEKFKV